MKLKDFGCLLVNNVRSRAYLQKMLAASYEPESILYVELQKAPGKAPGEEAGFAQSIEAAFRGRKYFLYSQDPQALFPVKERQASKYRSFDPEKGIPETLSEAGLEYRHIKAGSLNDEAVTEALAGMSPSCFLFCGGGILREKIMKCGKQFIHVHPGFLPEVRGSMAVEWSLLTSGTCHATALFMTEGIDQGDVIATREFPAPELECGNIAPYYSSHIRSELFLDILAEYARTGRFEAKPQGAESGQTYYKMHPLLNNLVFFKRSKGKPG